MLLFLFPLLALVGASQHYGRPTPYPCRFQYGTWGPCTATCGTATQTRRNTVYTPTAQGCPALSETRPCPGLPPCPILNLFSGPPAQKYSRRQQVSFAAPAQPAPKPVTYGRPAPIVRPLPPKVERPLPPVVHQPPRQLTRPAPPQVQRPQPPVNRPLPPVTKPVTRYGRPLPPQLPPKQPAYGKPVQQVPPVNPIDNSKYPVDCKQLDDGLVADPTNPCSHKFYSCANGITFERSCYGKLYYDSETEACDQYQYVPACSGNRRPPVTQAPYPTPGAYTPAPELDCTKLEDGLYADPIKQCSERYFVCDHGSTNEMYCAASLYFDEQSKQCDRYVKVYACTGRQYVEPEPLIEKNDHKEPLPVDFDCTVVEDGHYADPLDKCSTRFFHCANKIGYEKKCPGNTYFDEEFGVCDSYSNIPVCSGKPRPTPPAEIQPASSAVIVVTLAKAVDYNAPISALKEAMAQMLGVHSGTLLDVSHPSPAVIRCTAQGPAVQAAQALVGNPRLTFMYNGQYCQVIDMKVTLFPGQGPVPKPVYPYSCEGKYDGNYPASDCESYYWVCIGGTTDKMECPANTFYDSDLDQCELRDFVPGCGGAPRTPAPPLPPQVEREQPAYDCEQKSDGFYLPTPCSGTYYTCSNGETYEQTCPGDTKFLLDEERCETEAKVPACGHTGYGKPAPPTYGRPAPVLVRPSPPRINVVHVRPVEQVQPIKRLNRYGRQQINRDNRVHLNLNRQQLGRPAPQVTFGRVPASHVQPQRRFQQNVQRPGLQQQQYGHHPSL